MPYGSGASFYTVLVGYRKIKSALGYGALNFPATGIAIFISNTYWYMM
jgi:hypothetical protein